MDVAHVARSRLVLKGRDSQKVREMLDSEPEGRPPATVFTNPSTPPHHPTELGRRAMLKSRLHSSTKFEARESCTHEYSRTSYGVAESAPLGGNKVIRCAGQTKLRTKRENSDERLGYKVSQPELNWAGRKRSRYFRTSVCSAFWTDTWDEQGPLISG